jgi:uncharacterized protein (TIGR03435 family)
MSKEVWGRRGRWVRQLIACRLFLAAPGVAGLLLAGGMQSNAQPAPAATPAAQNAAPAAPAATASTTDIVGIWQGTLTPPNGQNSTRVVIKISKGSDGAYKAALFNADSGSPPLNFSKVTLQGADVDLENAMIGVSGKLSADGKTIDGKWGVNSPNPIAVSFARTAPDAAWPIPEAPKPMAADAHPSFDVATIKPNDSGATQMRGLVIRGREFRTNASSLQDLISFAYNVQAKQVLSGPPWMSSDRYDIQALPDIEGVPNAYQVKEMIQKLLADRFKLTFHHEQREMSAYVLEVSKSGQKLTPNESKGNLPGLGFGPGQGGLTLRVGNATMDDFTGFLQVIVLDRPVVNRTGLTAKYDFKCTFTPDDSQFNGHPPRLPSPASDGAQSSTADTATAPSLYEALEQEDGLKLTAEKTSVDVIVVDHVEKPSAN